MFFLPLYHNLKGAPCLVVGAGSTAVRKMRWLHRAGASIKVVGESVNEEVRRMALAGDIELHERSVEDADVVPHLRLIVAATNNKKINTHLHALAANARVDINCVDQPELCTVVFPAIVDRHPIVVAISSMGQAPTLSRVVRGWIELRLAPNLGKLAELADGFRARVKTMLPDVPARMAFWERLFDSSAADLALDGKLDEARDEVNKMLEATNSVRSGRVALVGAGPGDPELITLKALRLIQGADVILYDKLANPALLDYARRDAETIYVGKQGPKPGASPKRPDNRSNQQGDINDLIVRKALAGDNVVRLKGGDPFIYGRGGEELESLMAHDIDCVVVPGITAALGAASYANIPLTYRNLSQSVRFVTGHRVENAINLDWPELGRADQTLVIYMGLVGLEQIMDRMIEHGCEPHRPAALVEHATLPEQRVLVGTVKTLVGLAREANVQGPSVAIVGEVVAKRTTVTS